MDDGAKTFPKTLGTAGEKVARLGNDLAVVPREQALRPKHDEKQPHIAISATRRQVSDFDERLLKNGYFAKALPSPAVVKSTDDGTPLHAALAIPDFHGAKCRMRDRRTI